jgi:hypothetical protein
MVDVQTLLPDSLTKLFLIKSKTSDLGTALFKCQIRRIPELYDVRLMEFCCVCSQTYRNSKSNLSLCKL